MAETSNVVVLVLLSSRGGIWVGLQSVLQDVPFSDSHDIVHHHLTFRVSTFSQFAAYVCVQDCEREVKPLSLSPKQVPTT